MVKTILIKVVQGIMRKKVFYLSFDNIAVSKCMFLLNIALSSKILYDF